MKRGPLSLFAIVAVLSLVAPGGPAPVEPVQPAADVDAVSAGTMYDVGAPLPACGIAAGVALIEPGPGRSIRCHGPDVDRGAVKESGRSDRNAHHCDVAARLARSGIHTSALGTPPPHA